MPRVLNKYKDNIPSSAVYIGRPTKWGNPFVIGKDGERHQVIAKFVDYIWDQKQDELRAAVRRELKGKDLVCFCAPNACHGDVLLEIANEG